MDSGVRDGGVGIDGQGGGNGGNSPPPRAQKSNPPQAEKLCTATPPPSPFLPQKFFTLSLKKQNFRRRRRPRKFSLYVPPHSPPRPKDFVPRPRAGETPPPQEIFLEPPQSLRLTAIYGGWITLSSPPRPPMKYSIFPKKFLIAKKST